MRYCTVFVVSTLGMVENVHSNHDGNVQVGYFALDGVVRSLIAVESWA